MPLPRKDWGPPLLTPLLLLWVMSVSAQVSVIVDGKVNAKLGSDTKLYCRVETLELISQITWQRKLSPNNENFLTYSKGEEPLHLTPFGERVRFLGNGDLGGSILIPNVTLADEGTYLCIYTTFPSGTKEGEIKLVIQVLPKISLEPTEPVLSGPSPVPIAVCHAWAAKPAVNITWIFSGAQYILEENSTNHKNGTVSTHSQLITVPLPGHNGGNITCVVSQSNGAMENWSRTLTIQNIYYAPEVKARVIEKDDGSIQLSCKANSNPPATEFLWKRDERDLPDGGAAELGAARLLNADTWKGYYVCVAGNEIGHSSGYIYVQTVIATSYIHFIALILLIPSLVMNICIIVLLCRNKKNPREDHRGSYCCSCLLRNCALRLQNIQRSGWCGGSHEEAPTEDGVTGSDPLQRNIQDIVIQAGTPPSLELGMPGGTEPCVLKTDAFENGDVFQRTSMPRACENGSAEEEEDISL
ncbi:nectin-1 [Xenopus laevis]|nr:nectin-1 [Xenopus laevis]